MNTGGEADTVRVKFCVVVWSCTSVVVTVTGYDPAVPNAGVPDKKPLEASVTPDGRVPVSE